MLKLKSLIPILALLSPLIPIIPAQTQNANTNARPGAYTIDRYLNIRSASAPTFSAAGERVAFLTNITGTNQIWSVNSQGGWPDQLTSYEDRVDFVEWSPDGSGLVFGKAHGGDDNITCILIRVEEMSWFKRWFGGGQPVKRQNSM